MYNFDSRKATKCMALLDDGESGSNSSLTPNNSCKGRNKKDRPKHWTCQTLKDINNLKQIAVIYKTKAPVSMSQRIRRTNQELSHKNCCQ